ncbi:MAG: ACT domain-containing protein [Silicimonas sp.]|nr:ACT domain-containing protein [Silicimonas sp.]
MIAGMTPVMQPGTFVFCSMLHNEDATAATTVARGSFAEDEGMSVILHKEEADRRGLPYDEPMKQITLMVFSSITGVGLTAAVTTELAREKIPANVVAATQHDHIFVPAKHAERAIGILRALQARAQSET